MSFILDALKKSEQQRQQKGMPQQEVRKRTLSLPTRRQRLWPYWIVALSLAVMLCLGWWFYDQVEIAPVQDSVVSRSAEPPLLPALVREQTSATSPATTVNAPRKSTPVLEPSPVPRDVEPAPAGSENEASVENRESAAEPRQVDALSTPLAVTKNNYIADEKARSKTIGKSSENTAPEELPLYSELSRDLQEQMPPLAMSMHYYIADPNRRMVRINNLLLRAGDWISNDLQIVEITPTGATLDFFGKRFEMRSASR